MTSPDNSIKKYPTEIESALNAFIENAGKISANMLGMVNKVGGQIYALMFLSRKALSLDDISEMLQVSKGNVSINIRILEEIKLVKKVWIKGTRKDYYEANREYPKKLLKGFVDRIRDGINESISHIDHCHQNLDLASRSENLDKEQSEDAQFMLDQLQLLKSFYSAAAHVFETFYQGGDLDSDLLRRVILD